MPLRSYGRTRSGTGKIHTSNLDYGKCNSSFCSSSCDNCTPYGQLQRWPVIGDYGRRQPPLNRHSGSLCTDRHLVGTRCPTSDRHSRAVGTCLPCNDSAWEEQLSRHPRTSVLSWQLPLLTHFYQSWRSYFAFLAANLLFVSKVVGLLGQHHHHRQRQLAQRVAFPLRVTLLLLRQQRHRRREQLQWQPYHLWFAAPSPIFPLLRSPLNFTPQPVCSQLRWLGLWRRFWAIWKDWPWKWQTDNYLAACAFSFPLLAYQRDRLSSCWHLYFTWWWWMILNLMTVDNRQEENYFWTCSVFLLLGSTVLVEPATQL